MARTRLDLHEELCAVLGSRNCYFDPPSTLEYPCIKYELDDIDVQHADNKPYFYNHRYQVTIIDKDPDSTIYQRLLEHFSSCTFDRPLINDNLYHWIFVLYY